MSAALALGARTRRRGFRIGVAAGAMAPILLLLGFSLLPRGGSSGLAPVPPEIAEQRHALTAFERALQPLVDTGGATVVYGMRPGINDIHAGNLDDEVLGSMTEGWVDATGRLQADFAGIEIPAFLTETADLYRQSFDAYHETAGALLAAAGAGGEERAGHITRAAEAGTRGDQLYDAAKAHLAEYRARLGM